MAGGALIGFVLPVLTALREPGRVKPTTALKLCATNAVGCVFAATLLVGLNAAFGLSSAGFFLSMALGYGYIFYKTRSPGGPSEPGQPAAEEVVQDEDSADDRAGDSLPGPDRGRIRIGTWLVLSHTAVGAAMLFVGLNPGLAWWPGAVLLGEAIGLAVLLTLRIQLGIDMAEAALLELGRDRRSTRLPWWKGWPLGGLLARIEALSGREQEVGALRTQWRRRIGEAAAQEERNKLARDLHDSIKQQLFSINVSAAAAQTRWEHDPDGARQAIADVRRSAQEAMVEMQALLQQLRPAPLENLGLVEALREQCEALGYRTGAQVTTEFGELPPDERLPPGAQESIFRVAQEALANIARHARATQVHVTILRSGDRLVIEVRDNGVGGARADTGLGLVGLADRVAAFDGQLRIESPPGGGTLVSATLPLPASY
jgi:signal transduction histidine kinase